YFLSAVAPSPASKFDYAAAGIMQRMEWTMSDLRFKLRGARAPAPQVAIIKIDDRSINALHQWPWPRGIHAQLIGALHNHPPKALLFDVFFVDPFTSDPRGDTALAKATRENPWVVHSLYFDIADDRIVKATPPFAEL